MPPIQVDDEKHDFAGLHVVNIEFPPPPPRYSRLNVLRVPTWFGSTGRRQSNIPNIPPLPEIESPTRTADQQQQASVSPISRSETAIVNPLETTGSREDSDDIEKSVLLDRRWLGWTARRWAFVLGPCFAIVVMAVVLVTVFVTRNNNDSSSTSANTSSPTVTTIPSSATTQTPVPSGSISPTSFGAFNGTSIASAIPGNGQDALWVFYQDSTGDLCYIALEESGNWGPPIKLTVPDDGILNGTAITAMNWPLAAPTKINLIYQNAQGQLRNFLYTNTTGRFIVGHFENYNVVLPTNPNLIKRISWYSDDQYYHYIYFAGSDGLIREYTYNMNTNAWTPSFTFPSSNGYAGCAVLYDTNHNTTTMHLINTANQLQFYWRNYTNISFTTPAPAWIAGDTIPSTSTPLGFNLNVNSSLSMTQAVGQGVFAQDRDTNTIWAVGRQGLRDKQTWSTGVSTNASGIRDTDMYVERVSLGTVGKQVEYAFVQQTGDDVTLLSKVSGEFQVMGKLPIGGSGGGG